MSSAPLSSVHLSVAGQPVTTPVPGCGPDDWSTAFISSDGGFDTTHLAIAVDGMNHGMTIGATGPITGSAIFAAQYGL